MAVPQRESHTIALPSEEEVERKPTRFGYADALLELGRSNPNVVVFDADLSKSTLTCRFAEKYPGRFFDVGIAEQNMLGIAAGISLLGKIPFVTTYGTFVVGRAYDQIRTTVCYSNLNVKIAGAHGGISVGPDGATHQALEEITAMRVMPNATVIVPADSDEAYKATLAAAERYGPVYIRLGREPVPNYTGDAPFTVGRAEVYREGCDVAILAVGVMAYEALRAAEILAERGRSARVVNCHTVKPIDRGMIAACARECGCIVTAEEHQVYGGFGGAVAEVVVETEPVPMAIVGVRDRFGESGPPEGLMREFGLTRDDIAREALSVIERKKQSQDAGHI
jgi:transketolase